MQKNIKKLCKSCNFIALQIICVLYFCITFWGERMKKTSWIKVFLLFACCACTLCACDFDIAQVDCFSVEAETFQNHEICVSTEYDGGEDVSYVQVSVSNLTEEQINVSASDFSVEYNSNSLTFSQMFNTVPTVEWTESSSANTSTTTKTTYVANTSINYLDSAIIIPGNEIVLYFVIDSKSDFAKNISSCTLKTDKSLQINLLQTCYSVCVGTQTKTVSITKKTDSRDIFAVKITAENSTGKDLEILPQDFLLKTATGWSMGCCFMTIEDPTKEETDEENYTLHYQYSTSTSALKIAGVQADVVSVTFYVVFAFDATDGTVYYNNDAI